MSGRTGKLTREALAARGPRMVLTILVNQSGLRQQIIHRDRQWPVIFDKHPYVSSYLIAKSYSLSYLLRVAKGNK